MKDRDLARGLFLLAIALAFGLQAVRYPIGSFGRAGPGLFPLIVSSLLALIGLITIVRSRFTPSEPLTLNPKNIAIILVSLCGFAIVSAKVNMIAGVVFMVFCSSFAARTYSIKRNLLVSVGLVAVGLVFQKLLGFNLPLY